MKHFEHINPKVLFLLILISLISFSTFAQRSIRVGYIDTEYILQNVVEYQDVNNQLDVKVQKWKAEIESRLNAIEEKKKQLNNESVLLTKELIEERKEEIDIEEQEILEYQQKRFGPNGDLVIQRQQLIQPIQDQIFNAVQEIAETRNFDLVLDKSETSMLYSADRLDISERVLALITRSANRKQAETRRERKQAEQEETIPTVSPTQKERTAAQEELQAKREAAQKEKLDAREAKRLELEEKKKKIAEDRAKARQEKLDARKAKAEETNNSNNEASKSNSENENIEENKNEATKKLTPREIRQKALEEKKQRILEDRAKKAAEAKKKREDTNKNTEGKTKTLSPREARKKALEEKKKKILEDRKKAAQKKAEEKTGKDSTSTKNNIK